MNTLFPTLMPSHYISFFLLWNTNIDFLKKFSMSNVGHRATQNKHDGNPYVNQCLLKQNNRCVWETITNILNFLNNKPWLLSDFHMSVCLKPVCKLMWNHRGPPLHAWVSQHAAQCADVNPFKKKVSFFAAMLFLDQQKVQEHFVLGNVAVINL